LAPARLLDREIVLFGRQQPTGRAAWVRMHRVGEQHGLVVAQGIQQFFVARDKSLLLFLVELARDDFRLWIFEPQPISAAAISPERPRNDAEFLGDPSADLARRAARPPRPRLSAFPVARRSTDKRCRPPRSASAPQGRPSTNRPRHLRIVSVVHKQCLGDLLAAPAGRRAEPTHWPAAPTDAPQIRPAPRRSGRRSTADKKPARIMPPNRIQKSKLGKRLFVSSMTRGIALKVFLKLSEEQTDAGAKEATAEGPR